MLTMQSTNNDFWKWTKFEQIMINVYMQSCICIYISEESWLGSLRRQVLFTLILTAAAASQSVWCAREWFYWLGDHNWSILGERSKNILFGIIVKGVWHDIVYYGVFVQRFQTTISEVKSYKMVASCHVELREKKITLFHSLPLRYRKKATFRQFYSFWSKSCKKIGNYSHSFVLASFNECSQEAIFRTEEKTNPTDDVSNHNIGFVASMSLEGI